MVDITSLKVRLARLRLASELDDDPRLEDPAKRDLDKKRGKKKQKKASKDPYSEYTKNTGGKRKKTNKLTRSDQKRGKIDMKKLRAHQKKNKIQGPNYEKGYDTLKEYFDYIPEEERASVDKRLKKYGL